MKSLSFEKLPQLVADVAEKVQAMDSFIRQNLGSPSAPTPRKLGVEGLRNYLLLKVGKMPATQTVYGWVTNRKIPFSKFGKELRFDVDEIDEWLNNGRQMNHLKED